MKSALAVVAVSLWPLLASAQTPFRFVRNGAVPSIPEGYDLCTGDVDGDGDVDLVASNDHSPNQLFLNDGLGTFVDATAGRLVTPSGGFPANASYEGDLVDLDGDSDLDLIFVNDHNLQNRVYLNDGLGFFNDVTASALPSLLDWSIDQVLGDFDGDGDIDWYVSSEGIPGSRLYLNDGLGVFQDVTAANLPAGTRGDFRSFGEDLDQDGDLDIVLPRGISTAQVLVNQGSAVFALNPGLVPFSGLVHAADVDRDGRVDLLASNGARLMRNLGGLVYDTPVLLPGFSQTSLDFDGDGDADLLNGNDILVNDGNGAFTSIPGLPRGHASVDRGSICVADLDGDGDPDLVDSSVDTRPSAWFNFRRQLDAPAAPTVGQPYVLELHGGSPAVPIVFHLGFSRASVALPLPFGILRLDLRAGIELPPVIAVQSPLSLSFSVPPALVGRDIYLQALGETAGRRPRLLFTNALHELVR
jgi:hypothetical protein